MKRIYRYIKNKKLLLKSRYNKLNVLILPKIEDEAEYARELSRILWYGNPFYKKINKIVFIVSPSLLQKVHNFQPPSFADDTIMTYFILMKNKIEFITDAKQLKNQKIDIIIKWKKFQNLSRLRMGFPYIVNASVCENQFEANQMVKLSEAFLNNKTKLENNKRLILLLKDLQQSKFKSVTLFGSGPTLKMYKNFDYTNSLSIVCNSIVKNKDLLILLKPKIIVATDAVFHSGYSAYAAEFRQSLCEAFDLLDELVFIVPLRDFMLYKHNLPEKYQNRVYGLNSKNIQDFNLNIIEKPYVKSTSNVLTFFMIPLAASISNNINIIGFDGKAKNIKNKFWNYDDKSQFVSSIDYTRLAHPAFYNVDYDEYYSTHCSEVEKVTNTLLSLGKNCKLLTPSNIPALEQLS